MFLELYTEILYKIKKFFLIFLKPWYNWYNLKKCCIPTFIRSFLYQDHLVQSGTIGTNSGINFCIGGRAHEFCFLFFHMLKGVHHEEA